MTTTIWATYKAKPRALLAEARATLATLRAFRSGRIVLADGFGRTTVIEAGRFELTGSDGAKVLAEVTADEAYVLAATDYDGDVIRASDDG